jgi:asparagine synthase (glutamine-hydrolysing)
MTSTVEHPQLFGFYGAWGSRAEPDALLEYARRRAGSAAPGPRPSHPDSFAHAGHFFAAEDLVVAIEGQPLCEGLMAAPGAAVNPAAEVAARYRELGIGFLERLYGSFALALIDRRSATVVLAVDRMGIERLAFATSGDAIVFGSSPDAVARFPAVNARLRPQAFFDFLFVHMIPSPDCVYESVHKLRAGTYARFQNGQLQIGAYWNPVFTESGAQDLEDLGRELHASLQEAVAACRPGGSTGSFLSGGLDSSTVTGKFAAQMSGPAPTFSIGFGVDAYDELEYARIASRRFATQAHEYQVTPEDVVLAIPRIAAAYDEPFGNSSAVPTYLCAQLARRNGMTHLLAGDGGDEIFGGNERYATQKVFEAYRQIPAAVRRGLIEPASRLIPPEFPLTPLRKFRSYVDQARIPMPERLEWWNFMYQTNLDMMLDPALRAAVDPRFPFRRMAEVYSLAPARSLVNKMLFYDWQYTLADNDLRKVGTMCALAGVRVSYPMLHRRVVETSLRVPPGQKVAGLNLRAFFKRAMADFLPEQIIQKKKHGFGLPFGVWLKTHRPLADLIYSLLSDLKSRRIVRGEFLDKLIQDHRSGHPSFFGYAIWDLALLEGWLASHQGPG